MSLPAMYVLTGADGFTTCTAAVQACAYLEAGRIPLLAPITVHHWSREHTPEWTLCHTFIWNGSDATWR